MTQARSFDPLSIFTYGVIAVGVIMIGQLFNQSVLKHGYYLAAAKQQQYTSMEVQSQRGLIYAADTEKKEPVILAESIERYAVAVTPRHVLAPDKVIPVLSQELQLSEDELWEKLTFEGGTIWPKGKGNYLPPLAHGLTKDQVEHLASLVDPDTKIRFDTAQGDILYFTGGLFFIKEYQRVYPENTLAAHVLGYVNYEGKGQYGFEEFKGSDLQGTSGNIAVERDSRGRLLNEVGSVAGRDGQSYILTIDRNIQFRTEEILADYIKKSAADSGTIIVMHGQTGAILGMASNPTFDPNLFADVPQEKQSVFRNPAVSSRFEFGSVFKPLTVAMAIDQGLTTPDEKGDYPGSLQVSNFTIKNVGTKAYPNITMTQALEFSVNTAMVGLSNRLGSEKMYDYLTKLGFGTPTGVDLAGETKGYLTPLDKMKEVNRATISFGQGIDTTPLQMAAAYTAISNNGTMLKPHLIDTVIHPDGTQEKIDPEPVATVFKPETAQTIRDMMVSVVVSGHARQANVRGYKIAGKTGTAQVANPAGGYYTDRYRHSFISFAPADDATFLVFITLENPRNAEYAESSAAPAAGELNKYLLNYYQIPPTNR